MINDISPRQPQQTVYSRRNVIESEMKVRRFANAVAIVTVYAFE
jgi:hypothetical protein